MIIFIDEGANLVLQLGPVLGDSLSLEENNSQMRTKKLPVPITSPTMAEHLITLFINSTEGTLQFNLN